MYYPPTKSLIFLVLSFNNTMFVHVSAVRSLVLFRFMLPLSCADPTSECQQETFTFCIQDESEWYLNAHNLRTQPLESDKFGG